jgi:hypothetical protein
VATTKTINSNALARQVGLSDNVVGNKKFLCGNNPRIKKAAAKRSGLNVTL